MSDLQKDFYTLTYDAKIDIDEIFDFSESEFGYEQALEYFLEIETLFEQLLYFPYEGILRNDIKKSLRSIPVGSHIVFYYVYEKSIMIARILHQSQDVSKFFK